MSHLPVVTGIWLKERGDLIRSPYTRGRQWLVATRMVWLFCAMAWMAGVVARGADPIPARGRVSS
ncbi:MAG: hypothetical protein KZQ78_04370 [Candidatus Thiodiazotropha sp. (ex Ustalcina ferruginea)]|nr:hypothetical protein [Candidatus Thiodiazotropha sp. (ex Ustalcina ferruginea)]